MKNSDVVHLPKEEKDGGFFAQRLNESVAELADVRERLKALAERLGEAEACIRFYSDVKNYKVTKVDELTVFQDRLINDFSKSDNDPNTNLAGKRGRDYLKKYGIE